jgi:hypothetical protein
MRLLEHAQGNTEPHDLIKLQALKWDVQMEGPNASTSFSEDLMLYFMYLRMVGGDSERSTE